MIADAQWKQIDETDTRRCEETETPMPILIPKKVRFRSDYR